MSKLFSAILLGLAVLLAIPHTLYAQRSSKAEYKDKLVFWNYQRTGPGKVNYVLIKSEKMSREEFEIHYKVKGIGASISVSLDKIYEVEYFNAPPLYKSAKDAYDKGNYDKAIEGFASARTGDTKTYQWLAVYSLYYLSMSHLKSEDYEAAAKYFKELTANFSKSRFQAVALDRLVACYVNLKRGDDAAGAAKALKDLGTKYGSEWPEQAALLEADIHFANGSWNPAGTAYSQIANKLKDRLKDEPNLLQLYMKARRHRGQCLLNSRDFNGARSHFGDMSKGKFLLERGCGFLGLGKINLEEKKYREALFAFLTVDFIYESQESLQVEAMIGAGTAYAYIFKAEGFEKDKEQVKKYIAQLQRAGEATAAGEIESLLQ
ncbi:tol-pal system YbgF family protein [Planctomycetota bacterium]